MSTNTDAQKSEIHETTDDASSAPTSRAGQQAGETRKDGAPDEQHIAPPPGRVPGTDRLSEGHRSGRGE